LGLRALYDQAWLSVCDSRVLAKLARIVNVKFPAVITGSDITRRLIERYIENGDRITVIGCEPSRIERLRDLLSGVTIHHYNPPMGFINDETETERTVDFVVAHPSRFVFFAVGSPQQEKLAARVRSRGALGIGLCIGASILFVTGAEVRAPQWIQWLHLEWLFRLLQSPRRLWRRYLVDDPLILALIMRQRFSGEQIGRKRGPM
jgi:exopolysaccharide biosynthesis WecB/TagA/CpsF family protein